MSQPQRGALNIRSHFVGFLALFIRWTREQTFVFLSFSLVSANFKQLGKAEFSGISLHIVDN